MKKRNKIISLSAYSTLALFTMQLFLILSSWIVASVSTDTTIRSLLGNEGLRWLFGSLVDNVSSKALVWIILVGFSYGTIKDSRLYQSFKNYKRLSDYERMALLVVAWQAVAIITSIILLAFIPHAVLLSAVGTLIPSSFSASIVPMSAFTLCFLSVTYGSMTGIFKSVTSVFLSLINGVSIVSPLIVVYIFAAEFYCSLTWVLNF